jgi:predicted Zn-dependent peptidase
LIQIFHQKQLIFKIYMSEIKTTPVIKTISGDPISMQMHTLPNGLKMFMSVNKNEPRVQTEIAVRAGSKHDPAEATGLAHYFEHMMFKGTDRLGSLDWAAEKPLLDQIEQLFEDHRNEKDVTRKALIYKEIDEVSGQAAKFVAANEYDKMVSALGATGTNAYTWVEQTVYVNDIPTNELGRWFSLEAERFRRPILRVFHTELETIFEEFNMNQDKDFRKVLRTLNESLFPEHQYGTQTTIGRGEDLKNPSQRKVYEFFDKYYVPNNMAIILSGDFDPIVAIEMAEKTFGKFKSKPIPKFSFKKQPEIKQIIRKTVLGQEAEWVEMSWRFPGASSKEAQMLPLISGILYNQQAGLIDINLRQKQAVLEAYAYNRPYEDFCQFGLFGKPREGQSLENVEKLLLDQLEKLKSGDFEDWLPEAVLRDLKLSEIRAFEKNQGRADALTYAFVLGLDWKNVVNRWKNLAKITKKDIVDFANKWFTESNFVVVQKRTGDDPTVMKVEKPPMTPIELNRDGLSGFASDFLAIKTPDIEPQFVDFQRVIKKTKIANGLRLDAVRQPKSKLFHFYFILEMGRNSDRKLPLAANYFRFLGTKNKSATEIQQAFFRLGTHLEIECKDERIFLTLSGLDESFEPALALMEDVLRNVQPDEKALENLVADVFARRENSKKDKNGILRNGLVNWAKYGKLSSFNDVFSKENLLSMQANELTGLINNFQNIEHTLFYLGPKPISKVAEIVKKHHEVKDSWQKVTPMKNYPELKTTKNQVFYVNFPSVQVDIMLLSKGTAKFNLEEFGMSDWYNQYFGYGLSSIVFQEMRESRALCYSAYAYAASPSRKKHAHWLQAYIGTQPDKIQTAVGAFQEIMETMPVSVEQAEQARAAIVKQMAADRMAPEMIYWNWLTNLERGQKTDIRADVLAQISTAKLADLVEFQVKNIQGRAYTWLILGEKKQIDFNFLKTIGPVRELSLEELFGY